MNSEIVSRAKAALLRLSLQGVIYAGIVGSSVVAERGTDIDVVAITSREAHPRLIHEKDVILLLLGKEWLSYDKHEKEPVGLVPSILFKSIQLSVPIAGDKSSLCIPKISVCKVDFINAEIKRRRYEGRDRKNYLVALIFEKLLENSSNLSEYCFDNLKLAKKLGLEEIYEELRGIYSNKNICNIQKGVTGKGSFINDRRNISR